MFCPNLPHSPAIFVKVSKSIIFLVKSFLGNFYRLLAIFFWSHGPLRKYLNGFQFTFFEVKRYELQTFKRHLFGVWPDFAKFLHFGKLLMVYFLFGKMLSLLWQIFDIIGIIFTVANGQILKNTITIWSHCLFACCAARRDLPAGEINISRVY